MITRDGFFGHTSRTSSLGFGTPALMAIDSGAERERLFGRLIDGGVTHFDTARYYGYGQAERVLGQLVGSRRSSVTITTKFGIQPPQLLRSGLIQSVGRRVLHYLPGLRSAISRRAQAATSHGVFTPESARQSLEASLRALGTSYVDLLLLHEPTESDALNDDLVTFLHERVAAGDIRAFGCGGNFAAISRLAASPHRYLQFPDNPLSPNREAFTTTAAVITFGSIGSLPRTLSAHLEADPRRAREYTDRVGVDCSSPETIARLLIRAAGLRNPGGLCLFAASRTAHVDDILTSHDVPADQAIALWTMIQHDVAMLPAAERS